MFYPFISKKITRLKNFARGSTVKLFPKPVGEVERTSLNISRSSLRVPYFRERFLNSLLNSGRELKFFIFSDGGQSRTVKHMFILKLLPVPGHDPRSIKMR